jgi:O-antigen/teichoic acid export membrane protein
MGVAVVFCNAVLMSSDGGIRRISVLNVSASVLNVLALSALVLFGWAGVYGALLAYFVGMFVRLIPAANMAMTGVRVNFADKWFARTRQLARYSAASFMFTLMVALVFRIDAFIVGSMLGFDDLGKYSISVAFAELALMLPSSIGTALFASLPRQTATDRVSQLQVTTRYVVLLTILICAALAAISSPLVRALMGEAYSASVAPLLILLPGVVAMATNYVFANFFAGSGLPHAGAGVFAFGLVVNVCANLLLIPILGINGAALASSISYIGISLAFYLLVWRTHRLAASTMFLPRLQDVRDMLDWAATVLARQRPRPP